MEDGVIGYKDLAALPRDKAILDIERPDLMIYQPHYCYSPLEVISSHVLLPKINTYSPEQQLWIHPPQEIVPNKKV